MRGEHQLRRKLLVRLLEDPRLPRTSPTPNSPAEPRMPRTRGEWQDAVDAAEGALCLGSARQYGLVTGGPEVNLERAAVLLREGKRHGITPAPDAAQRFASACMAPGYQRR